MAYLYSEDFKDALESVSSVVLNPWRVRENCRAFDKVQDLMKSKDALFDKRFVAMLKEANLDFDYEPASIYSPEGLQETIIKYFKNNANASRYVNCDRVALNKALFLTRKAFAPIKKLERLDLGNPQQIRESLKKDTSSGFPLFRPKIEAFEYGFNRAQEVYNGIKKPNPCFSFFRTQRIPGEGNKSKTRLIWAAPIEMTMIQATYARPVIDYYVAHRIHPISLGFTKVEVGAKVIGINSYKYKYCVDYSSFDSTINSFVIKCLFNILFSWFSNRDLRIEKLIVDYFNETELLTPWGVIRGKRGGIPSGDYFTQIIGSMANYFLLQYNAICNGESIYANGCYVLGDDSIFGMNELISFDRVCNDFRVIIHPDKTDIVRTGPVHYLGRYYDCGIPHGDPRASRTKLVCPERNRNIKPGMEKLVAASYLFEHVDNSNWVRTLFRQNLYYGSQFFSDLIRYIRTIDPEEATLCVLYNMNWQLKHSLFGDVSIKDIKSANFRATLTSILMLS